MAHEGHLRQRDYDQHRDRSHKPADRRHYDVRDDEESSRRRRSESRESPRQREHKRSKVSDKHDGGQERRRRSHSRSRSNSTDREKEGRRRRERGRSDSEENKRQESSNQRRKWGSQPEATAAVGDIADGRRKERREESETTGEEMQEEEDSEPLPVTLFKDDLMKAIRSSQVLVCTGETGSGKTTQIPQYLLELVLERDSDGGSGGDIGNKERAATAGSDVKKANSGRRLQVAVTQPRRVAATSVARRVADERKCRLGEEVGYSIRFEDRTGPNTRIKYCTDGVLVRECLEDPFLNKYGVVMLDEAHERSIDTDVLFGLLKRALARRPDLKAVITSATLDVERFAAFFGNCPFVRVPGRTHEVDVYHSKTRQVRGAWKYCGWFTVSRTGWIATDRAVVLPGTGSCLNFSHQTDRTNGSATVE